MTRDELVLSCIEERERLIDTYLGDLPTDKAVDLGTIVERIDKMEEEYKLFLAKLWHQSEDADAQSLRDVLDKNLNRWSFGGEYAVSIQEAHSEADEVTLWEQITNSNDRDIKHLNSLIIAYAKDLLAHITLDFMEDVK